ncbi:MAG: NUDIX domain protein [Methanocella sp. PtaU1.Bin125]|nr:MAG: NUDIX domain protein [Methanocella sp. PtaU1.Bin125]
MADRFVVCCYGLVFSDGKILIVRHKRPQRGNRWALPGGRLKAGEGFQRCIERMVEEQTSCTVKAARQITAAVSFSDGMSRDGQTILVFYLCKYQYGGPDAGEGVEAVLWADEELFTNMAEDMDFPYQFIDAVSALCIRGNMLPGLSFDFSKPESILRSMIID